MRRTVALCAVVAGLAFACSDTAEPDDLVTRLADLCGTVKEGSDLERQESAFFDRAHDALHELAQEVTDVEPGVAAELLEAKQVVETQFAGASDGPVDVGSLERLIETSNRALIAVDKEPIAC